MRKFFLFVLPAVLCTTVAQANTTLWKFASSASDFDSLHQSQLITVIAPEKVCEAAELRLKPSFTDSSNTYLWITPAGKQTTGVELIINKTSKTDAGVYVLKVLSAAGEVQTVKTEVKVQPLPNVSVEGLSSACEGSVYNMTAKGSSAVEYAWITPAGNIINNSEIKIAKLSLSDAGVYNLNASDKGCVNTFSFNLNVKRTPSVAMEGATIVCENSAVVIKTKQESAVKYIWWKGQNIVQQSPVFTVAKANANHAGKYILQAKENGCMSSASFNIEVKPSFAIGIDAKTDLCSGEQLMLKAKDAGEGAVYNWSGPNFSGVKKEEIIENVSVKNSGNYSLSVSKNGCSLNTSVTINVKEKGSANISGNTSVCETGELKLWVDNKASYTWILPNGSKQNGSVLSVNKISKAEEGVYKLISGTGNCSDSNSVVVKVNAVSKPNIVGIKEMCEGTDLKLTAENAIGNIVWRFANSQTYTGRELTVKSALGHSGNLQLTVDNNGCVSNENVLITVKQAPVLNIIGSKEVCRFTPSYQLQAKDANGLRGLGMFSGEIISKSGEVSTVKEGVFPINYSFIAQNGCSATKTETLRIKKGIEVNAGADLVRKGEEAVQINALATDNYTKIEWTNISAAEAKTLRPTVKPDFNTTYKVTVTNAAGCMASDEVTVKVMKVSLPNAFSPNGDGINDYFTFEGLKDYPNAQIQIFNGIGKQVFAAKGIHSPWDGRVNGVQAESGTYYYNIKLNDGKQNAALQGWIQLKR
jgi:gliding motility-associated-like protein